jgi:hypothetical protein
VIGQATLLGLAGAIGFKVLVSDPKIRYIEKLNKVRASETATRGAARTAPVPAAPRGTSPALTPCHPIASRAPPQNYEVQRAKERKAFDTWLAAQPFDDEVATA